MKNLNETIKKVLESNNIRTVLEDNNESVLPINIYILLRDLVSDASDSFIKEHNTTRKEVMNLLDSI